jgi:SAM-dependent methyltransferase
MAIDVTERGVTHRLRRLVPAGALAWLRRRRQWLGRIRPIGGYDFGELRRIEPVSRVFGRDRGTAVDRYYIERFLDRNSADMAGRVAEFGDATYTRRFGVGAVGRSDVIHAVAGNPDATIVGDLATGAGIPSEAFDCVICTQTLQCVYDVRSAVETLHRMLKRGGVALVTVPGISQISRFDMDRWGDYWRFTSLSAERLFRDAFDGGTVDVRASGNVLASVAFMQGVAAEELRESELAHDDQDYQLLITVRAVKTHA